MRFVAGRGCHGEAAGTDSRRKQLAGSTAAESYREEGAMAKVPGSDANFGKECTFAA